MKKIFDFFKQDKIEKWDVKTCAHPEHDPPKYVVLKPGIYEHICPGCGRVLPINVPFVRW